MRDWTQGQIYGLFGSIALFLVYVVSLVRRVRDLDSFVRYRLGQYDTAHRRLLDRVAELEKQRLYR